MRNVWVYNTIKSVYTRKICDSGESFNAVKVYGRVYKLSALASTDPGQCWCMFECHQMIVCQQLQIVSYIVTY